MGEVKADEVASELAYFPEGQRHSSSVSRHVGLMMPVLCGAAFALVFQSGPMGLVGLSLAVGWVYWQRRRAKRVPRALIR